ncbi:carboxymuconolactone decarboxylase family protein [Aeromicrobium sp.]|uniref:carboxymuconolactone decarboxylase family protein n=1 Tax=Aeromicrobium sp. TaxID=1871063 RepID=UPI003D6A7B23
MTTTPRITPGGRRELGVVNHVISTLAGRVVGGPKPNVFTTLGRQRGLFRAWLWYSARMMPGGRLPRRETEMVILHIATLRGCEYERNHHLRIGRRVGLTAEQVEHTGDSGWDGWSIREKALLAAVTQLVQDRDIDDHVWAGVRAHLDEAETIELLMLCGQYDSLATTLMTLRVQPE